MTATTRQISEENLHQRLAVAGPDDELKDLADTIDGLLARLDAAFDAQKDALDAQRRFVANASHELRGPLTLAAVTDEVLLARHAEVQRRNLRVDAALHPTPALGDPASPSAW